VCRVPDAKIKLVDGQVHRLRIEPRRQAAAVELPPAVARLRGAHPLARHLRHGLGQWGQRHETRGVVLHLQELEMESVCASAPQEKDESLKQLAADCLRA